MNGIQILLEEYLKNLKSRNYSANTVEIHRTGLEMFLDVCEVRNCEDLCAEPVRRFETFLVQRGAANSTRIMRLVPVMGFLRFLRGRNLILLNDDALPRIPRSMHSLPRAILTEEEIAALFRLPVLDNAGGFRLRAYLEMLYGTGIRKMEMVNLNLYDLNLGERTVMVRNGKGAKDRVIPVPRQTVRYVGEYIRRSRHRCRGEDGAMFISCEGSRITLRQLQKSMCYLKERARNELGILKPISCHVFRHTIATHLIQRGVDIRYVQAFLGHSSLSSTQIYTRIVRDHAAREILGKHPREKMKIPLQ